MRDERDVAQQLAVAREDERRRVSREWDDALGPFLAGLSRVVRAVADTGPLPSAVAAWRTDLQRVADQLAREVDGLAGRGRPTTPEDSLPGVSSVRKAEGRRAGATFTIEGESRAATRVRVFLIDEHPADRADLRVRIDSQPDLETVGEASDAAAAAREVTVARPDVVVMGVSVPGGAAAAGEIARFWPAVRVLALVAHDDQEHVRQVLAGGATGWVARQAAADDLIRAVRAVAAGQTYLDPAPAGAGPPARWEAELSDREAEVVKLIARGYRNKEIAARLVLSVKTVETYKARSMEKLGVRTRVGLVEYAAGRGWLTD